MRVEWNRADDPVPVFVAQFEIPSGKSERRLGLFGARYDTREALFDGASIGDGHLIEYFVAVESSGSWQVRRLLQRESVTYSDGDDRDDYRRAKEVDERAMSPLLPPRWERKSEALWPTVSGKPMLFVGQTRLPDNQVTRNLLTWDTTLYLFWFLDEGEDRFKLVEQNVGEQSAEDHYAQDEEWGT